MKGNSVNKYYKKVSNYIKEVEKGQRALDDGLYNECCMDIDSDDDIIELGSNTICCLYGCTNKSRKRSRFSLGSCHPVKKEMILNGENRICDKCYYKDHYLVDKLQKTADNPQSRTLDEFFKSKPGKKFLETESDRHTRYVVDTDAKSFTSNSKTSDFQTFTKRTDTMNGLERRHRERNSGKMR